MQFRIIAKKIIVKKQRIKNIIFFIINYFPFNNKIKIGNDNKLNISGSLLKKCAIIIKGKNNIITIDKGANLSNTIIIINGDDNNICISNKVTIRSGELWIEDCKNTINIKENTLICGRTHLACIEGCSINIGKNCLFSSDIVFRTGDSHSILDMEGKRINQSKDIIINDHVWIGNKVTVNKGVIINKNSVIGAGSVVTKAIKKSNVILAGVPAQIIKENINWSNTRIPFERRGNK